MASLWKAGATLDSVRISLVIYICFAVQYLIDRLLVGDIEPGAYVGGYEVFKCGMIKFSVELIEALEDDFP